MHLRSGKSVSTQSKPCRNPIHRKPETCRKTDSVRMAELAETITTSNQELIKVFQESLGKLQSSLQEQSDKNIGELATVNANIRESMKKTSSNQKSASALGRSPVFSGNESEAQEFLDQFNAFAEFHGWDDKQKITAFSLSLSDAARTWYFTLEAIF